MSKKNNIVYKFFGDLVSTHMVVLILKVFEKYSFFCSQLSMLGGGLSKKKYLLVFIWLIQKWEIFFEFSGHNIPWFPITTLSLFVFFSLRFLKFYYGRLVHLPQVILLWQKKANFVFILVNFYSSYLSVVFGGSYGKLKKRSNLHWSVK